MKSHKFKSARLTHLTYLISVPACWSHCRHDEKMSQHKTCGPKSDAPSYSRNSQAKQYPTSEARDMKVLSRILPCFLKVRKKIAITPASPCHSLFFQGLWAVQAGGSDQQEEERPRTSTDPLLHSKLSARPFALIPQLLSYMKHWLYLYAYLIFGESEAPKGWENSPGWLIEPGV